jgi:hypothetical protein
MDREWDLMSGPVSKQTSLCKLPVNLFCITVCIVTVILVQLVNLEKIEKMSQPHVSVTRPGLDHATHSPALNPSPPTNFNSLVSIKGCFCRRINATSIGCNLTNDASTPVLSSLINGGTDGGMAGDDVRTVSEQSSFNEATKHLQAPFIGRDNIVTIPKFCIIHCVAVSMVGSISGSWNPSPASLLPKRLFANCSIFTWVGNVEARSV